MPAFLDRTLLIERRHRFARALALTLAVLWTISLFGGPNLRSPGRFGASVCFGMLIWDENCAGTPGLALHWCRFSALDDLGPPAPFLPFWSSKPLTRYTFGQGWTFGIPLWPLVLAPGIWAWWNWRLYKRRTRVGLCATCGYRLEGLPGDIPCPECGATLGAGR